MALFGRRQPHKPLVLSGLSPAQPPVGRLVVARGAFAAIASANAAHRPPLRPTIKRPGTPPPVGKVVTARGDHAARDAANFAHRPLYQPRHLGLIQYQLPPARPPIGKVQIFGALASQAAAHALARLLPLRAKTIPFPVPAAFLRRRQLVPRDPLSGMKGLDSRLRRFTEIVSAIFNSLILAGLVRQTGPEAWTVQAAAFVRTRAPLASDDTTAGAVAGSVWVDTTGPTAYLCTDAGRGVAAWVALSGGGGGGLSGSFP